MLSFEISVFPVDKSLKISADPRGLVPENALINTPEFRRVSVLKQKHPDPLCGCVPALTKKTLYDTVIFT